MATKTMEDVKAALEREKPIYDQGETPTTPEGRVYRVLVRLADSCQSFDVFVEQALRLPITGAGIDEVATAKEYLAIVLESIIEE